MIKHIFSLLFLVNLTAVIVFGKSDTINLANKFVMQDSIKTIINNWQELTKISLAEIKRKGGNIEKNVSYDKIAKLTSATWPQYPNSYFYFNSTGKCVMLYISEEALTALSCRSIEKTYGNPDAIERSRAGKPANHYVYSTKGFAFSELNDEIVFFEIFPKCSLNQYKDAIYTEPPIFKK